MKIQKENKQNRMAKQSQTIYRDQRYKKRHKEYTRRLQEKYKPRSQMRNIEERRRQNTSKKSQQKCSTNDEKREKGCRESIRER
jgi:hypothetical protein